MRGLNESQFRVFTVLAGNELTIGSIAQKTGMHRQSVRIILQTLLKKRYLKVRQLGNKFLYSAEDLGTVERMYLRQLETVENQVPRLKALYNETKDTQTINVLTARFGLRTVLLDEIMKGNEIVSFQLTPLRPEYAAEYDANALRRKRLGIPLRVLTPYESKKYPLTRVKHTTQKSKISIYAYANKTTFIYDDQNLTIITLKIPEIAKYFKGRFNEMWKR